MIEKDWKKEVWQLHLSFHDFVLNPLDRIIQSGQVVTLEQKAELQKISSQMHSMFDTLVMWVERLADENLKLQGALEEARRAGRKEYYNKPNIPVLQGSRACPPIQSEEMSRGSERYE